MGSNNTLTPKDSAKVSVTGIDPPSLVKSGLCLYTAYIASDVSFKINKIQGLQGLHLSYLCSDLRSLEIPVVDIRKPRFPTVQILHNQLVLAAELGEFGLEMGNDQGVDELGCLGWHKASRIRS